MTGTGARLHAFMDDLFPICRSISGAGVRQTLDAIGRRIPLEIHEVPSGAEVLDWTVPDEWNVRDAYIAHDGRKVVDFRESSLHLVSYSEPFCGTLSLTELEPHLHTLPEHPEWIPYRTSYYSRTWGFCLAQAEFDRLADAEYEVVVDTTLERGSLTYGECFLPGKRADEVLLTTHICHPSLANDNLSGIAVLTELGALLNDADRALSYRLLFIPGTIGSVAWLAANRDHVDKIAAGVVVACVGDSAPLTYKRSRRGNSVIDRAAAAVLPSLETDARIVDFIPWGWDERQFNSPGFDLPVGCLSRSREAEYPQYHSSADDMSIISPEALETALSALLQCVDVLEGEAQYVNLSPEGEPQLGKRGLYTTMGGSEAEQAQLALLWVLNQSDGGNSLLDIAERSGLPFVAVRQAADRLVQGGLLADADRDSGRRSS